MRCSGMAAENLMESMPGRVWILLLIVCFLLPAWGTNLGSTKAWAAEWKPVQVTAQEVEVAASLKEREADLAARQAELSRREAELMELDKEVDEKLRRLTEIQADLTAKLSAIQVNEDKQFKNLIKIYSSMSASKVAPFLNKMEDETVARILRAMKTDAVSKIMPKLETEKAVRVSKLVGMLE